MLTSQYKKYHIITYGCQMNKNDSERMAGLLENIGYTNTEDWQEANLILLNTCSIRDKAERRVSGKFHQLNHFRKKHNKEMELGIMGCMPQHAKKMILEKLSFIDYVVGVNNMEDLPNHISKKNDQNKKENLRYQISKMRIKRRAVDVENFEEKLQYQVREDGKKAWVSIQFGCNKVCSYCIVPYTRGREISRKKENILDEITTLKEKGFTQVVLLGQNVNSYGLTIYEDYDFADLLEDVATKFPWLKKIDFLTSYPTDVTQRLIDVIAKYDNITDEIHFPIQHGDDEILELMDRNYTVAEYLAKVERLRAKIPDVSIGTDLIVGFPGETEEHFQNMLTTLRKIKFDFANTAAFSIRPGTKAARMKAQVTEEEKKRRLHTLNKTLEEIYMEKRKEMA